jgi:hypothetical protein
MTSDNESEENWEDRAGLADETTSVRFYINETYKQRLVEESGDRSLSSYIRELIGEARYIRNTGYDEFNEESERIQELEDKAERLRTQLEEAQQTNSATEDADAKSGSERLIDEEIVLNALDDRPQSLQQIVDRVLDSEQFHNLIAGHVEAVLYDLAAEDQAEYDRKPGGTGTGWKKAER